MKKSELADRLELAAKLIPSYWHDNDKIENRAKLNQLALLIREGCLTPKGTKAAQEYLKLIEKDIDERIKQMAKNPSKPYFIKYTVEHGLFGRSDPLLDTQGLTQDLITISCITQPSGAYSQNWVAINGATQEPMHNQDVFKAWILMAKNLSTKSDLAPEDQSFCATVFEIWRKTILAMEKDDATKSTPQG